MFKRNSLSLWMWNNENTRKINKKWRGKCKIYFNKSKKCTNCYKYREKNQGCNYIICRKVVRGYGYEFCWIYFGESAPNGTSWYKYIKYNLNNVDNNKEKMKFDVKYEMEKYTNYMKVMHEIYNPYKYII
jgi:hypothetical protein